MRLSLLVAFAGCAVALAGCGSADSSTVVSQEGDATLTLRLQVPKPDPANPLALAKPPEEVFDLPDPRVWSVERGTDKDGNVLITATRQLPIGQEVDAGVSLLSKKTRLTRSKVRVDRTTNGWRYAATLEWLGEAQKPNEAELEKASRELLSALPAGTATPQEARAIAQDAQLRVWRLLFGPPEPLLPQILFSSQESVQRKLRAKLFVAIEGVLASRLGNRLSTEQRRALAQAALSSANPTQNVTQNASAQGQDQSKDQPLLGLSFAVRLPGRIVLHNGLLDPVTSEVYWDLLPQAAQPGPVVLHASSAP